ncbi:MAG: hypothetical protein R3C99_27580 [Pirellulaceae bacterium]
MNASDPRPLDSETGPLPNASEQRESPCESPLALNGVVASAVPETDREHRPANRFRLATLFEFTTICALLTMAAAATGWPAALLLLTMTLALLMRRGIPAIAALAGASFAADWPFDGLQGDGYFRQVAVLFVAGMLSFWFAVRAGWPDSEARRQLTHLIGRRRGGEGGSPWSEDEGLVGESPFR